MMRSVQVDSRYIAICEMKRIGATKLDKFEQTFEGLSKTRNAQSILMVTKFRDTNWISCN